MTTLRYTFTGQNLYNVLRILYGKINLRRALVISDSILSDKVFDASLIAPVNSELVKQELIAYVYSVYQQNFTSKEKLVNISNRLRQLNEINPYEIYSEGLVNFNLNGQPNSNINNLSTKINRDRLRLAAFRLNNNLQNPDNIDEILALQQFNLNALKFLREYRPGSVFKPGSDIIAGKFVYTFNPNFISANVIDFSLDNKREPSNSRFTVNRASNQSVPIGIFFDPEVFNNAFDKRIAFVKTRITYSDLIEERKLNPETDVSVGDIVLTTTTRYIFIKERAETLLNILNGRLDSQGFAVYIDGIEKSTGFDIESLTFYSVRQTGNTEYLLPIFNTNNLQSGYGLFNKDSSKTFNTNNL